MGVIRDPFVRWHVAEESGTQRQVQAGSSPRPPILGKTGVLLGQVPFLLILGFLGSSNMTPKNPSPRNEDDSLQGTVSSACYVNFVLRRLKRTVHKAKQDSCCASCDWDTPPPPTHSSGPPTSYSLYYRRATKYKGPSAGRQFSTLWFLATERALRCMWGSCQGLSPLQATPGCMHLLPQSWKLDTAHSFTPVGNKHFIR